MVILKYELRNSYVFFLNMFGTDIVDIKSFRTVK